MWVRMSAPGGSAAQPPPAQANPPPYYPYPPYYYYPPPPPPVIACPRCGASNYYGMERCHACSKYLRGEKHSTVGGILVLIIGIIEMAIGIFITAILGESTASSFGAACMVTFLVVGILAIAGGVAAIKKTSYAMAIIGGVCTCFSVIGILGLVLIIVSKDDFE